MNEISPDLLPAAMAIVDADGRILDGNALLAAWTGVDIADLRGERLRRFLSQTEPMAESAGDIPQAPFPSLLHSDGSRRPVLVSRREAPTGVVVVLSDATQRHRYEEELRGTRALEERTRNRLQLVIDASIAFAAAATEGQLADILAYTVAQAYRAEESAVFLVDERGAVDLAAGVDPFAGLLDSRALAARAVRRGQVLKITDADDAMPRSRELALAMRATGVQAIIVAPMRHDDVSMGIFACFFHHPRRFDAEAGPLADALAGQAAQVATTLRLQRRLQHAATHDATTGLPNRRYLEERDLDYGGTLTSNVAVIFIDLDGFKRVNDEVGHHAGDHLLREVGRRLQAALREDDIVVRYGGDEFIVICEVPDTSGARDLAERLRRNLGTPFDFLPDGFGVGGSIGISIASRADGPIQIDALIRAADQAMYRAKAAGGSRIVVDTDPAAVPAPSTNGSTPSAGDLARALRGAVHRGEIAAWFQPQIDLRTGTIVAAEALCRWLHPKLGLVSPATFIPIAEDTGLIGEIGRFMTEQCYLALAAWSTPVRPIDVSVNVSPVQLRTSELTDWLVGELTGRTFSGGRLTMEITESRPIADVDSVLERLEGLRALGVGVAIDDFGAGHATLDHLTRLHGTEIKLDRSLVSDLSDRATAEMANAIAVAHRSGVRVVAEGVETEAHLERATRLGCDRAQGFLISRPLPAAGFAAALRVGVKSWRELALG